ncbi:MAG: YncE family protein, partial [Gammaproteobacteria bacterium]
MILRLMFFLPLIALGGLASADPFLVAVEKKASEVGFYNSSGERVAGVPVGQTPHEMILDPDGRHLYVSDNGVLWMDYQGPGGNTISIVDIVEQKKVGTISLGDFHRPHGMDIDPQSRRMIVTAENPDRLVLLDLDTGAVVEDYDNGGSAPHMVTLGREGKWAYASNSGSNTIGSVNLDTGETVIIPVGQWPQGSVLSSDGERLYVTNGKSGTISVIDTAKKEVVGTILTEKGVNRIVFTPDESTLVYSIGSYLDGQSTAVGFADVGSLEETDRIQLGGTPLSISLSSDGEYAFAGVQDNDEIYVISVEDREVVQVINTPEEAGP